MPRKVDRADPFATADGPKMRSGRAPLRRFKPYPNNPRTHPPAEITLLANLIKAHGADQPIVVDEHWVILKGHGRRTAAIAAGAEDFPYVQRFGMTDAEKTAMRIADNQVPLLAGWDVALVRSEITQLHAAGYKLELLGFGDAQLVQFTTLPGPPAEFPSVGEDVETSYCCPRCGHSWSGKAKPDPEPATKRGNGRKR